MRRIEGSVGTTVEHLHATLQARGIPHEILVVNDGSSDGTWPLLQGLQQRIPELQPLNNEGPNGFGRAIVCGLNHMRGDAVVIWDEKGNAATVTTSDVYQSNGVIHVVDTVLMPAS